MNSALKDPTVGDICQVMDRAYPPFLAESWDRVGLICGDPADPVHTVVFALDCTQEVADAAVAAGADMLIVHHPLLLRGVTSVAGNTPKGKVIQTLIRGGVALFAAHTNADSARPGVNDALAELVGITPGRPIKPQLVELDKWAVFTPKNEQSTAALKDALFSAGAGAIGDYSQCSFAVDGKGQFLPGASANPAYGEVGKLEELEETRIEFVAPRTKRRAIEKALRAAHEYEEPAFDIVPLAGTGNLDKAWGLGRVGELPEAMTFGDFVQQVANNLPSTVWGVRAVGDRHALVKTIAVSSGSGDSFLDDVSRLDVDVYVTSDLRHHPVDEALRAGAPFIVDTAHWASEFPWTYQAADIVAGAFSAQGVTTEVLEIRTDPWTISAHKDAAEK